MTINVTRYRLNPDRVFAGTRGSYGMEKLELDFGDGWDFGSIAVTFHPQRSKPIRVPYLPGAEIDIPAEVMAHSGETRFVVSGTVIGGDGEIERKAVTLEGFVEVAHTSGDEGGNAKKITATEYEMLIGQATEIFNEAREDVEQSATEAEESAKRAEDAAKNINSVAEKADEAIKAAEEAKGSAQNANSAKDTAVTAKNSAATAAASAADSAAEAAAHKKSASDSAAASRSSESNAAASANAAKKSAEDAAKNVTDALTDAKNSGEFDGEPGRPGDPGRGIVSVVRTSGTGAAGTVDTYTITYTDGTTSTFAVYNGKDGTPYVLTAADKSAIAAEAAGLVNVPVLSVNGKTGAVSIDAGDVNADPAGTASGAVTGHNVSETSHNDIRLLITGLTNRLNAIANSTDEDLDQLAEIVTYIKANKSLIDSITTSKVSVADVIDNLTTSVSNKPLSARMGVELKKLIDAIKIPTSLPASDVYSWAKQPQKPTYTASEVGAATAQQVADLSGAIADLQKSSAVTQDGDTLMIGVVASQTADTLTIGG